MRVVSWNIEWMNNWFVGGGQVEWRNSHGGIADVQALAARVARVILNLDPDVLTVQEGPSDPREMDLFLTDHLSDANGALYTALGGVNGGSQKGYILVKRNGLAANLRLATDQLSADLVEEWEADVNADAVLDSYNYTRDPVIVDVDHQPSGDAIRILTLHTKSKYVHGGRASWNDPNRRQEFIVAALRNRRRISAEAMHTREYLDALLYVDANARVVLTGDLNDGPGIDFFERNYLTHGVADTLLGSIFFSARQFRHGLVGTVPMDELYTAIFDDFVDNVPNRHVLLDHIMVSPALAGRAQNGSIAHAEWQAGEDPARPAGDRDRHVSDHRPVVVEIT